MLQIRIIPLFFCILSAQRGLALTRYVDDNSSVIAVSVHPCRILGDADLYGLGMRIAFYISYAAGIFGVLFGFVEEMRAPRFSFNILLLSILIVLIRNTLLGSFALFEWYIVISLSLLSLPALVPVPEQENLDDEDEEDPRQQDGSRGADPGERRKEQTLEEQTNQAAEDMAKGWAKESSRAFLSDAIGLGFLYVVYGLFACLLPWLYFTRPSSGHKEGCPVPIVFFGTFDLFNGHWQGFLKFTAVSGVLGAGFLFLWGFLLIISGLAFWKVRTMALELLDKQQSSTSKVLQLLEEKMETRQQGEPDNQDATEHSGNTDHIIRLARKIQEARGRAQEAAEDGEAAKLIIKNTTREADEYEKRQRDSRKARLGVFVLYGAFGSLNIWFLEKTLRLNNIDLEDEIGSSSGQMFAMLVSIFTTVGFMYEGVKGRINKTTKRVEEKRLKQRVVTEANKHRLTAMRWEMYWESQLERGRAELLSRFTRPPQQPTPVTTEHGTGDSARPTRSRPFWEAMNLFRSQRAQEESDNLV